MKSIVVGTAGHIDHGKSALVHALTGTDPDRLKEEKARGITIDLGFAQLVLGDLTLAFVDVPGHERFVKNMLAGVGGIDVVLLVVAADESVMPQTREHVDICRLLRVSRGIVALTKSDLADADMLDLVRLEVRELLAGTPLASSPIVPVSSRTGAGLDEIRVALTEVGSALPVRAPSGAARLPIDRVFSMKGFGTVVTGTLASGRIRTDDELFVAPGHRRVKVRGLQVHGVRSDDVVAGQRVAANLAGSDVAGIVRGDSLVAQDAAEQTRVVDAVLEVLPDAAPIRHGARIRFHQGTTELFGRVSIIGPADRDAGPTVPVAPIAPGSIAYVRVRLEQAAVLTRGDRFIVRSYSPARTIGGGHILDPRPPKRAIRTEAALERCRVLDPDAPSRDARDAELAAAAVMIADDGDAGMPFASLSSRAGIAAEDVSALVDALAARGAAVAINHRLVARPVFERLKSALMTALAERHRADPSSEGLPREEARVRLAGRSHPSIFARVVDDLASEGKIVGGDRLALATHHVEWPEDARRARDAIDRVFRDAGLAPPDAAAIAAASGAAPAVVSQVLQLLQRQKVLVKIDALLFHEAALERLKQEVARLKAAGGSTTRIDVPAFKQRFGVTRKFAIPLLEYLDRERITRRDGDVRVVL